MIQFAGYRSLASPDGQWRQRARRAILKAIDTVPPEADEKAALKIIDAAYPFGQRAHFPYKQWLVERRTLRHAIRYWHDMPPPDLGDLHVCTVARDLVEEGKFDHAVLLMTEQAPNRHNLSCPACGAPPGTPCRNVESRTECVVPHESRLTERAPDYGPLFAER